MAPKNGFTVIELVVVVSILAVVAALAVPNMHSYVSNRRFVSAVDELYVVFQKARVRAIREAEDVVVRFDMANNLCEAFVDEDLGGGANRVRDGAEARVELVELPEGVAIDSVTFGQPWCGFDDRGLTLAANGTGGQLRLRNTAGRYLGVGVNLAGNVRLIRSDDGFIWN
jgi:prepilin-type N-terminal cleavage/methylation domain-containing protein